MNRNENMIVLREACEHLRVSEATMRRFLSRASTNGIPYHRVGIQYRFYKSELSEWASSFGYREPERTEALSEGED